MTFAEELRNAVTHTPATCHVPVPEENVGEAEWAEFRHSRTPQPRVTAVRVLGVAEGFNELYAAAIQKGLFERPLWQEMGLQGSQVQQLWDFLRTKCPEFNQAAIWTQGTYYRLLVRTHSSIAYSALSLGQGMTEENRLETYRALWDVGIRTLRDHVHRDTPHYQTMLAGGHWTFEEAPNGRYLIGTNTRLNEERGRP